jgi:hypothetical protein
MCSESTGPPSSTVIRVEIVIPFLSLVVMTVSLEPVPLPAHGSKESAVEARERAAAAVAEDGRRDPPDRLALCRHGDARELRHVAGDAHAAIAVLVDDALTEKEDACLLGRLASDGSRERLAGLDVASEKADLTGLVRPTNSEDLALAVGNDDADGARYRFRNHERGFSLLKITKRWF